MSDISEVVKGIQGNPVAPGTLGPAQDGYVYMWDGTDGYFVAGKIAFSGPAGGDLEGNYTNLSVKSISGYNINGSVGTILPNDFIFHSISPDTLTTLVEEKYAGDNYSTISCVLNSPGESVSNTQLASVSYGVAYGIYNNQINVQPTYARVYDVLGGVGGRPCSGITGFQDLTANTRTLVASAQNVNIGLDTTTGISGANYPLETAENVSFYASNKTTFSSGGLNYSQLVNKNANYTATNSDYLICCDSTSNAVMITLPSSPNLGDTYIVKDSGGAAATNHVTVSGNGNNIQGYATFIMSTAYQCATLIYNGSTWLLLN